MPGESVCEVIASDRPGYAPGDIVLAHTGWRTHAAWDGPATCASSTRSSRRSRPASACSACPVYRLFGPLRSRQAEGGRNRGRVGGERPGRIAGRAARQNGRRSRRRHRRRRQEMPLCRGRAALRRLPRPSRRRSCPRKLAAACPKGIDVYFENVGGAVWQAVLPLAEHLCAGSGLRIDRRNTAPPVLHRARTFCPPPCARY